MWVPRPEIVSICLNRSVDPRLSHPCRRSDAGLPSGRPSLPSPTWTWQSPGLPRDRRTSGCAREPGTRCQSCLPSSSPPHPHRSGRTPDALESTIKPAPTQRNAFIATISDTPRKTRRRPYDGKALVVALRAPGEDSTDIRRRRVAGRPVRRERVPNSLRRQRTKHRSASHATRDYAGMIRTNPSWTMLTTCVPSRVNSRPIASPRAPDAVGEDWS